MNKLKKVVLSIALCVCLGFSAIAFSACSTNLSEEQTNKLMTVVDNSDKFMDEILDNLESTNEKLDREKAYGVAKDAISRVKTNSDNSWDNMSVIVKQEGGNANYDFLKLKNGKFIVIEELAISGEDIEPYKIFIDDAMWSKGSGETFEKQTAGHESIISFIVNQVFGDMITSFEFDDVLYGEILEDGSCRVVTSRLTSEEQYSSGKRIEILVDNEMRISSMKIDLLTHLSGGSYVMQHISVEITYGNNTESDIINTLQSVGIPESAYTDSAE